MNDENKAKLENYLVALAESQSDALVSKVEKYFDDEAIEIIVDYIEEFYGVKDDEELGMLAQVMITGFITAKESGA